MTHWLVVTDLDGTLLDDTYPFGEAGAVLERVQRSHVPTSVALASSKTLAEMQALAAHTVAPLFLIFENGAGIAWRDGALLRSGQEMVDGYQVVRFGVDYERLREVLIQHRSLGYTFSGFGDMSIAQICERTGLDAQDADRARQRLMSEPIVWQGEADAFSCFRDSLLQHGLTLRLGGRFHHVSSGANKATALGYLLGQLHYELGIQPSILACGDAPNDLELIERADQAVLFPQKRGGYLLEAGANLRHAPRAGPSYWLSAVQQIIHGHEECA